MCAVMSLQAGLAKLKAVAKELDRTEETLERL